MKNTFKDKVKHKINKEWTKIKNIKWNKWK